MVKYINTFDSATAATAASADEKILSPNVTYVSNGTDSKLLMKDAGDDAILEIKGDSISGLTIDVKPVTPSHEWVDLGIVIGGKSVKFSKYNVGVDPTKLTTAEDWYGDYVAWGETSPYYTGSADDPTFSGGGYNFTPDGQYPYVNTDYEEVPGVTQPYNSSTLILNSDKDAVTAKWGDAWRMPTRAELEALTALTSTWVTNYNGVSGLNGRLFQGTGTGAGNSLFVPAAGGFDGTSRSLAGGLGGVWSSSRYEGGADDAWSLYFNSNEAGMFDNYRCLGHSLRGVLV